MHLDARLDPEDDNNIQSFYTDTETQADSGYNSTVYHNCGSMQIIRRHSYTPKAVKEGKDDCVTQESSYAFCSDFITSALKDKKSRQIARVYC